MADDKIPGMIKERPLKEGPKFGAPEQAPVPEQKESEAETKTQESKDKGQKIEGAAPRPAPRRKTPPPIPQFRDEVAVKIEKILEDGIGDAYSRLSPVAKQEFKIKGEETAQKIRELLKSTHIKVKKVFQLILEWLKLLPGVNKFFLEQEAKIKTDKIIALHEKNKK